MKQLIKIDNQNDILNLLYDFDEVFPHLKNKVSDYNAYAQKLKENAFVYKAVTAGETFGILVFYANDTRTKTAYISLIGVKKGYRSKGFGKYLLDNCIQIAKSNGMTSVMLEVDNDNENAVGFYKKNDFNFSGLLKPNSCYMKRLIL